MVVRKKLDKELGLHRISGPYTSKPFENFICSPLGLVPKKSQGEFRIIHDLSFPEGNSVNEHIPRDKAVVQYESIENVIQLIKKFGVGALMAKLDIENGYRNIPIHPLDYHFLGFVWNNQYYFDKCLPMGASSACQLFEKLSTSLQWIMLNKYKASGMSHLIDDFFFIGPPSSQKCLSDVKNFENLCQRLGVPLKQSKTILPTTCLTIYGIEIDSVHMISRLPEDKLVNLRQLLAKTVHRRKVHLKELQSLIGSLNFACQVVTPGRAFLRRLIDLTCHVSDAFEEIDFTSEERADIKAWQLFIDNFNGKSIFHQDEWQSSHKLHMYTDASGSMGYAAVYGSKWFVEFWLDIHANYHISIKELFPIVLLMEIWGTHLSNQKILFFSDNLAVVQVVNKQSCKDKTLMKLVRRLVVAAMKNNILFKAKHIPGKQNVLADYLSRFKFQEDCPMVGLNANSSAKRADLHLSQSSQQLLQASLSPSAKQLYLRSWTLLHKFCVSNNLPFSFPFSVIIICNFVGDLFTQGLGPATITSHVSAISYVHKLYNVFDPTHSFIVRKILKGSNNLSKSVDTRLPITKSILIKLLSALQHTVQEHDGRVLLSAVFLLAFHAFMRLGELVPRNISFYAKVIQRQDVQFLDDNAVQIILRHAKNFANSQPIVLTLSANALNHNVCPVQALKTFTTEFKHSSGPLFTFKSGRPVPHSYVTAQLKHAVSFIGLDTSQYAGHSFRIGAATEAAKSGLAENVIQQLGRWHSSAIKRYIRINSFQF